MESACTDQHKKWPCSRGNSLLESPTNAMINQKPFCKYNKHLVSSALDSNITLQIHGHLFISPYLLVSTCNTTTSLLVLLFLSEIKLRA